MNQTKDNSGDRYLAFLLGNEGYAIPLLQVKEVIEMSEPTPIPQSPSYYKGIINLRGQVISILDLRTKLELEKIKDGAKKSIIILDLGPNLCLGVIVDKVSSVQAFTKEDVSDAPEIISKTRRHIMGVAKKDSRLILILDIKSTLSISDLEILKNNRAA